MFPSCDMAVAETKKKSRSSNLQIPENEHDWLEHHHLFKWDIYIYTYTIYIYSYKYINVHLQTLGFSPLSC